MKIGNVDAPFRRLNALAQLDEAATFAILNSVSSARHFGPHHQLLIEGHKIACPLLIIEGWAARVRVFADGRRQLLSLLLPGDLIGFCGHSRPRASSTVISLTDLTACIAPDPSVSPTLREAYSISSALEEAYLLAQIARLGRLSAHERICDLFLELHERLQLLGVADHDSFKFPLTQEKMADLLGLTSVHVNRMLQLARKAGELHLGAGRLTLNDPEMLAQKLGRPKTRVTFA